MNASDAKCLPIGVFDSGVGGLTVLKALRSELPNEDLVYLGDTARLPYGTKSPASISRYACQATRHLQQRNIKLLVVACNTASAVALEALRAQMAPLPVIGVVEPGAAAAVAAARPGGEYLVLATEATVGLGAYRAAILQRDANAQVREIACELLVSLAEEGWNDGMIAEAIVGRYLDDAGATRKPDSVILGCTHFPLLRETFEAVFENGVAIVDSATTTAIAARELLAEMALAADRQAEGALALLATDGVSRFARVGGQFLGRDLASADVALVDL